MFERYAFRLFGDMAKELEKMFPDLKEDLKKAGIKFSSQEYIASSLFMSLISFIILLPFVSLFISIASQSFLFAYLTAILVSLGIPFMVFFIHINYPKSIVNQREKEIEKFLPFSVLYLSSIIGSGLNLNKTFKTYVEFSDDNEFRREIKKIVEDVEFYGLDIITALERAINRSPSKKLREFFYGILATLRSGGDLYSFMRDSVIEYILDYRRKLSDFSRSMMLYTQIYLLLIVLGPIFFTILTSIMSIIGGVSGAVMLHTFVIFVVLPVFSILFLYLVKKANPFFE